MGKAARLACIFTPMALTIASFIALVLIEVAGWNTLDSYYFFRANLTDLDVSGGSSNSALTTAIGDIKTAGGIGEIYNVYLWNYCSSNKTDGSDTKCSKRETQFVFDPIDVWQLNTTGIATSTSSADNAIESAVNNAVNNIEELEDELLGKSGKKALDAYRKVAKWMFIAYQISFWTTLATIIVGILALFSRWGSLFTWILSAVSSFFTIAAVLTSTILFSVLVGALNEVFKDYNIKLSMGHNALVAGWLGVVFSLSATLFWLMSICCCSGRSNPHHKSNKGGLWNAEPKGQGYGDYARGRGLKVEKTGGDYERVASPYMGGHEHEDQVPLQDYQQPAPYNAHQGVGYEPYRHN
ncbi:SUR7 family protein pun1 [Pseudocercospora fuligena]|uniref:SUR7 family protein pun1 n=1 Tax=Pseudocercospora fuligena TaxID=685502 RepID=A0A8H6VH58_9PEZI|nr:SUR7 family protein pun1 [Pseudocercospora fuligena]